MVKFLIIGVLHGNKPKIHFKGFDAIIAPGDFCGDEIRKYFDGWGNAKKKDGKPYKSTTEYLNSNYSKKFLKKLENDSLKIGRNILKYLNSFGKPVFIIPGNWDDSYGKINDSVKKISSELINRHKMFSGKETNKYLTKGLKNIVDCQFKLVNFRGYNLIGYGLNMVPELPSSDSNIMKVLNRKLRKKITKKDWKKVLESYNKLFNKIQNLFNKSDKKYPLIYLSHNMPYNTKFDRIKKPGHSVHNKHYGSMISRDFILKNSPLVCIGGHMHEYFGKIKLGKTIVVNSGFGSRVNVLLELEGKKIKTLKFYPKTYG